MTDFKYRPDVDGLRAVAVILVLLFHARLGFSGGFVGVDVFFVISGYLITGLIFKQQGAGKFTLTGFWARRIRRILPAACVLVVLTLIAGAFLLFPSDYTILARSAVYQQLMLANVFFWRNTGYFSGPAELMPLLHTWSLAVEEQFYLFYPFLLVLLNRTGLRTKAMVLAALALGSLALSGWGVYDHASASFYLLPTRAWELLLGGLLCLPSGSLKVPRPLLECFSAAGLLAILASAWLYDSSTRFPGIPALAPCLGTALLIYANSERLTVIGRFLAWKPVVFVGLISYSLYLWHWPILAFSRYWFGENLPTALACFALAVSQIFAIFSWRFVETPFRRGFANLGSRPLVLGLCCTLPVIVGCALLVIQNKGFPNRVSPVAVHYLAARDSKLFLSDVGMNEVERRLFPKFGDIQGSKKCLLWGDSHARSLGPGIDAACKASGFQGYQATHSSTAPIFDFVFIAKFGMNEQAPAYNRAILDFAIKNKIDVVILGGLWNSYVYDPSFEKQLSQTIDELHKAGIAVAVVLDIAMYEEDVPMTLARRAFFGLPLSDSAMSLQDYRDKNKLNIEVIQRAARGKAFVLDPSSCFIDDKKQWRTVIDGKVMYRDRQHLTTEGGLRLTPLFEDLFKSISEGKREPAVKE